MYDDKGEEYVDFVSGIAVNCLGHSNINDNEKTSRELIHISNLYYSDTQMQLAKKLIDNSEMEKFSLLIVEQKQWNLQ